MECIPGYNGGSEQDFHLEVYIRSATGRLLHNITSPDYPLFVVHSLPAGNSFALVIHASNSYGQSRRVELPGSTLLSLEWENGET